ncbi:MAG: aldolase/citrate lyase family protein [Myxococcota bacterium]
MVDVSSVRSFIRTAQSRHRATPEMVRGLNVPYWRRGEMSIPGFKMKAGGNPATDGREQSLRIMKKAATMPVDFFFFDLEDAAPDHEEWKPWARKFVVEALTTTDSFGKRVVGFRPNNIRTAYFEDDMVDVLTAAGNRLHALVLPKSETVDEVKDAVQAMKDILRLAGHANRVVVEVLIESPRGFLDAERIAAIPEVAALVLGSYDFARTLGGRVETATWLDDQRTIRQSLPILAAAHGKDAVDAITAILPVRPKTPDGISEEEALSALRRRREELDVKRYGAAFVEGVRKHQAAVEMARRDALDARRCGFAAKWILHPDQIEPIQGAWTPSADEARSALKMVAAYAAAAIRGSGAELDGQRLADKAVVGMEWWQVESALRDGILSDGDIQATGFTLEQLRRTVRTRD